MNYDYKEIGLRIRYLRKENQLTQEQMADNLNIGLSYYGKIERGECGFSLDVIIDIASYFGVSLDYLILGRENQTDALKKQVRLMMEQLIEIERNL